MKKIFQKISVITIVLLVAAIVLNKKSLHPIRLGDNRDSDW